MTHNEWLALMFLAGAAFCAVATAIVLLREAHYRDLEAYAVMAARGMAPEQHTVRGGLGGLLQAMGNRVVKGSRLYSRKDIAGLEDMIAASGFNPKRVLPIVLGGKVALMVLIPAAAITGCMIMQPAMMTRAAIIAVSFPVGMLGPDWVLSLLRRPYAAALHRGIIDALDLRVVCSEAGLGLESALERVTREMQHSNRPTANALGGLLDEIRVLPERREAFANFARRSGIDGMQRLATMLSQSLQYGTPLGQALRTVAAELRRDRMIKLEERAAKLPAKLVLPLILFIMPCLIIILVGSSFLRLFDVLAAMTQQLS